jgi:hypothetical protein
MSPRSAAAPALSLADPPAELPADVIERRLPSGRSLVLRIDGAGEEIEIRSARGELDLRITLTDAGPVVSLRGARLEVESPDVAFRCRTFDVQATEALTLASEREVRVVADEVRMETQRDIHLNGAFIRLNCDASGGPSADEIVAAAMAGVAAGAAAPHDHEPHQP